MLQLTIPATEYYDEKNDVFVAVKEQPLQLEHSLLSVSKWESKWHKPFLGKDEKSAEESLDYVRCMTITKNVPEVVYNAIGPNEFAKIDEYLEDSMTATWFSEEHNKKFNRKIVTSELIYYWMVSLQIPFECEKWHLNRLITLVRVCNAENEPPKKMSNKEHMSRRRALNAARKQQLNSRG